jgi:hypothetical protein
MYFITCVSPLIGEIQSIYVTTTVYNFHLVINKTEMYKVVSLKFVFRQDVNIVVFNRLPL